MLCCSKHRSIEENDEEEKKKNLLANKCGNVRMSELPNSRQSIRLASLRGFFLLLLLLAVSSSW